MKYYTCDRCKKLIVIFKGSCTTGYGTNEKKEKICFDCCGEDDKQYMREHKKISLYLFLDGHGRGIVTNWPGSIEWKNLHVRKGRHNIAGVRYDVWFWFEGTEWHGVCYGDNTQILHCQKLQKYTGYKTFLVAGRRTVDSKLFLTSEHTYSGGTVFHNNAYSTIIKLPMAFYREHFVYNRSSCVYRNKLSYADIQEFVEEVKH